MSGIDIALLRVDCGYLTKNTHSLWKIRGVSMCAIGSIVIAGVLVAGCEPKKPLHPQKVVATCDQEFRAETGQARQCVTITFSKVMPAKLQSIDLAREAQAEADARR